MLKIKKLLHDLPDHNFETFRYLAEHLHKVAANEEDNKVKKAFAVDKILWARCSVYQIILFGRCLF